MDSFGINAGYLLAQLFVCIPLLLWVILAVVAVLQLRRLEIDQTAKAIWVLILLLVPVMGAVGFFIVKPGQRRPLNQKDQAIPED